MGQKRHSPLVDSRISPFRMLPDCRTTAMLTINREGHMFLFHDKSPITFDNSLPNEVDVVIIGGGIIGICTAWYLLQQGSSVLVCDKGRIAGEQSSRNWGWLRVTGRDPDEVPIAIDSLQRWKDLARELPEDFGYAKQGLLSLAETEDDLAECEAWVDFAGQCGFDTRLLSPSDLGSYINVDAKKWRGGIFSPDDARAEPFLTVPAIARGVQSLGGAVRENCAGPNYRHGRRPCSRGGNRIWTGSRTVRSLRFRRMVFVVPFEHGYQVTAACCTRDCRAHRCCSPRSFLVRPA